MTEKEYLETNEALMNAEMQLKRDYKAELDRLDDEHTQKRREVDDEHKRLVRAAGRRYSEQQQRNMQHRRELKRQYQEEMTKGIFEQIDRINQQDLSDLGGRASDLDPHHGC